MDDPTAVPAAEIQAQPEVREALRKTVPAAAPPPPRAQRGRRIALHVVASVLLALGAVLLTRGRCGCSSPAR